MSRFCVKKQPWHGNRIQTTFFRRGHFLRITFNFASQNLDFASQTAMRYRINSSLEYILIAFTTDDTMTYNTVFAQGCLSPSKAHFNKINTKHYSRMRPYRNFQFENKFRCSAVAIAELRWTQPHTVSSQH